MSKQFDRIIHNRLVNEGKPSVGRPRVLVSEVFDHMTSGKSQQELIEKHPGLEGEDIKQAMEYSVFLLGGLKR